ncbi:MAG TPA: hypothetical protein DIT04_12270 [Dysgonomonas sp.]|nr:hypothetical protein [Dysgonomonas sp.]
MLSGCIVQRIKEILKQELLFNICNNYQILRILIKQSIHIYNNKRPHLTLKMKTPNLIHPKHKNR